jgi:hypothetical protein
LESKKTGGNCKQALPRKGMMVKWPYVDPRTIIYQLTAVLQGLSPMIWRRLLVCGDSTIADLHYIIQIAMGWSGDHLHQFRIHGKRYGIARMVMDGVKKKKNPPQSLFRKGGLFISDQKFRSIE